MKTRPFLLHGFVHHKVQGPPTPNRSSPFFTPLKIAYLKIWDFMGLKGESEAYEYIDIAFMPTIYASRILVS